MGALYLSIPAANRKLRRMQIYREYTPLYMSEISNISGDQQHKHLQQKTNFKHKLTLYEMASLKSLHFKRKLADL
jgi:hypothetical protein